MKFVWADLVNRVCFTDHQVTIPCFSLYALLTVYSLTLRGIYQCTIRQSSVFFFKLDMYAQSGLVTELMDKAPPKVLKITYAGNNTLNQISTGKENTPTQAR